MDTFLSTNFYRFVFVLGLLSAQLCSFGQDVILETQADVDAFDPATTLINGRLVIGSIIGGTSNITDISNLINLTSIGGYLWISSNFFLTNVDGLSNLTSVGGYLRINSNAALTNIDGLSNFTSVGEYLRISSNAALTNVDGLSNLTSVGGYLRIYSNAGLTNVDGLSNLTSVGDLRIYSNPVLINVDGLSNFTSVGDLRIYSNAGLTNLDGLSNLTSVGSLRIYSNAGLTSVDGLSNLTSVGVFLSINSNAVLTNVDGLSNLTGVGGGLSIDSNAALTNVDGLSNLTSIGGTATLRISSNAVLKDCCGIQKVLTNHTGIINISGNPSECSSASEILSIPCRNSIHGNVYYDYNQNKIQDLNEGGIARVKIIVQEDEIQSRTNRQGAFNRIAEEEVTYNLSLDLDENWQITTEQDIFNFTFNPDNAPDINFGLYFPDPVCSGEISLVSENTRCNTEVEYYVTVKNIGSTIAKGEVKINLDPQISFISSTVEMVDQDGYLVQQFDTLYPFQTLEFTLLLDMPSEQSTGELITVSGEVYYNEPEGIVLKDETTYESIVLCSYDPNDKQVSPAGVKDENYTLKDSELQYTVRFQNTGNAPAIDVRILDTLDENLDLETFKVTQSSFPVFTSIKDRAVEFYFQDIWLVDSLSNEPESHGFISYTIKAKEGLDDLTEIENTAHIIFDFNPAIITNTTSNSLVDEICDDKMIDLEVTICEGEDYFGLTEAGLYELEESIGVTCDSFTTVELTVLPADDPLCTVNTTDENLPSLIISPNPFQDELQVRLSDGVIKSMTLYDIQGRVLSTSSGEQTVIKGQTLSSGLYLLKVVTAAGHTIVEKVIKE